MFTNWNDSRLALMVLAGDGVVASGEMLRDWWRRASRCGRLDRELQKLERQGLVSHSGGRELDGRLFRITAEGRRALTGAMHPEEYWHRPWDGRWRLVLFDVPQVHAALRTRLRRKLRELRFGWLQNSVWLSPDPVSQLTQWFEKDRATVERLVFLEARPAGGESDADLVLGAWDFARLARMHTSYLELLRLRPARERRASAQAWMLWAQTEQRAWGEILRADPMLPEVLWPPGYAGRTAWQARKEALIAAAEAMARLCAKA